MAGVDKLAHLDRWPAAARLVDRRARRCRRASSGSSSWRRADRVAEIRDAPWLPDRVVVGRRRRDAPPRVRRGGPGRARGARRRRIARGRRPRRPRPRRRATASSHPSSSGPSSRPPRSTAPRSRSCRSPTRSSGSPTGRSPRPSTGASSRPPRRRRESRRQLLRDAFAAFPPAGPETWTDEAALLEACNIPVHALPGEPSNLKVTAARRSRSGGGGARSIRRCLPDAVAADRERPRQPSVRARDAARARRHRDPGRLQASRALRWRRRPPRDRRCAARRGRPRRPRPDLPRRPGDAARDRQPRAPRRGRGRIKAARLPSLVGRPDDRRRPSAPGGPPRRDARRDRGACSSCRRTPSTSRRRPATSAGWRAPDAASRPRRVAILERIGVTIRLHDTLTGETRPLEPLEPGHVRIYSCGPTVYGPAHIGNFRSFLFADLLVRYLRYRGLRVTWVMNITDVDDKIIRGAAAAGIGIDELANRWLERFLGGRPGAADDAARRPAAGDRAHRRHGRAHRDAAREGPRLPNRRRLDLLPHLLVAGLRQARPARSRSRCGSASGSRPTSTPRTTSATSRSGRAPSRASRRGRPRSVRAGRAGTSSARRCR